MLFDDDDKARTLRTADGFPVHSFQTMLADLATIAKNRDYRTGITWT